MCKGSNIFSELGNFFKENAESKVINSIVNMMNRVNLVDKTVGIRKRHNCKMQYSLVLQLLLCYPFFKVKDPSHYVGSTLGKFYRCGKDMFFSHTAHRSILGMKLLTLMLTDAKTQLMLDYSLCGEKGKNKPASVSFSASKVAVKPGKPCSP